MKGARAFAAAAGLLAILGAPALACDSHEDPSAMARHIPGRVLFQPAPPESPRDGDIWIDARTGAQHLRRGDSWVLRAPTQTSLADRRRGS